MSSQQSSYRIERADAADAEAMAQLWVRSIELLVQIDPVQYAVPAGWQGFAEYLGAALADHRVTGFVARASQQVIGFIHGQLADRPPPYRVSRIASIDELYVDPERRWAGVGTALVEAFEAWARTEGILVVELSSHLRSPLAQSFWEHRGYLAYADFRRRAL